MNQLRCLLNKLTDTLTYTQTSSENLAVSLIDKTN